MIIVAYVNTQPIVPKQGPYSVEEGLASTGKMKLYLLLALGLAVVGTTSALC